MRRGRRRARRGYPGKLFDDFRRSAVRTLERMALFYGFFVTLSVRILAAIAEFERARVAERVRAGLAWAKAQGQRLGGRPHRISDEDLKRVTLLSIRGAAKELGVPPSVLHRARASRNPVRTAI